MRRICAISTNIYVSWWRETQAKRWKKARKRELPPCLASCHSSLAVTHSEGWVCTALVAFGKAQVYDNLNKLWRAAQTLNPVIGTKSNGLCFLVYTTPSHSFHRSPSFLHGIRHTPRLSSAKTPSFALAHLSPSHLPSFFSAVILMQVKG